MFRKHGVTLNWSLSQRKKICGDEFAEDVVSIQWEISIFCRNGYEKAHDVDGNHFGVESAVFYLSMASKWTLLGCVDGSIVITVKCT